MLLGVDVGGTFTDAVLIGAGGVVHSVKVPTTPEDQSQGVIAAVHEVLARANAAARGIERFAHGTTVTTNALLEGRTARTALIATEGFTDVIELARQARPRLYDLCAAGPAPLAPPSMRFGAPERMGPDGPIRPLEESRARELVGALAAERPDAVAVALLHSYAHPQHERMLGALVAEALPDCHCSLSHELVGTFREYERAATTEIDAGLSPLLADYLHELAGACAQEAIPAPLVMQSAGGLIDAPQAAAHAALTVLSGPAGGVGGALLLAQAGGEEHLLCFDMGGTSCDVCLIDGGGVAESAERTVAGRPLALPAFDIHTVGAGGGSIAWRDPGGALRVGPRSAGAQPGPACYGRGGVEPTVTDANVVLGRLLHEVPLADGTRLDARAAEEAVAQLARELDLETIACAEGIVRVAEAEMLRALRTMTVERGVDPRAFALMPFGGAGGLHAAALAGELGIERVLCPMASGVLSALGLAAAAPRRDAARTVMLAGAAFGADAIAGHCRQLSERLQAELGGAVERVRVRYELRYTGQSFELAVDEEQQSTYADPETLRARFEQAHELRYGFRQPELEVELVTIRLSAWGAAPRAHVAAVRGPLARERRTAVFGGAHFNADCWIGVPEVGAHVAGPAVCALPESTVLVPPGWSGTVDERGTIALERSS